MQKFSENDVKRALLKAYAQFIKEEDISVMPKEGIFVQGATPHGKKAVEVSTVTKNLDCKEVTMEDGTVLKVLGTVQVDGHLVEPKVTTGEKITTVAFSLFDDEKGKDVEHKYVYMDPEFLKDMTRTINGTDHLPWEECVRYALEQATQLKSMPSELVVYNGHYRIEPWVNTVTSKTNRMVRKETAKITDNVSNIFLENIPITATLVRPKMEGEDPIQMGGFIVTDEVKNTQNINRFLMTVDGICKAVADELIVIAKEKEAEHHKQYHGTVQVSVDTKEELSFLDRIKAIWQKFKDWLDGNG